jgi:ribosomal-protein-alanine N-acetyltransferase
MGPNLFAALDHDKRIGQRHHSNVLMDGRRSKNAGRKALRLRPAGASGLGTGRNPGSAAIPAVAVAAVTIQPQCESLAAFEEPPRLRGPVAWRVGTIFRMPARIRPAGASDVGALVSIEERAFDGDRISQRSFRRLLRGGTADVLVAFTGDKAVGYSMVLYRSNTGAARLYSIAVESAEKGVGRALLEASESAASRRGARSLRLEVREGNTRAIDLYEKNGYLPIGRRPEYYQDGATALRYEKQLAAPAMAAAR